MVNHSSVMSAVFWCQVVLGTVGAAQDDSSDFELTTEETALLEKVLTFVIDPRGKEYVSVPVTVRTVHGEQVVWQRNGWRSLENGNDVVQFGAGDAIRVQETDSVERVDFVGACRAMYRPKGAPRGRSPESRRQDMQRLSIPRVPVPDVVYAAWLYRLGETELASRALQEAQPRLRTQSFPTRSGQKPVSRDDALIAAARTELGIPLYLAMIHAYMVRADDEARDYGKKLQAWHPDSEATFRQLAAVMNDLERREKNGTFGKVPAEELPEAYQTWNVQRQVTYWIDQLDEVDVKQPGQPSYVPLFADYRVAALIQIGDAAVPDLIATIDGDERLTRSVHYHRDFGTDRTVLSVREAALAATMSITKMRVFEPFTSGDNFTARGPKAAKVVAARLRQYWESQGKLSIDDRMMKTLTSLTGNPERWREAAANLSRLDARGSFVPPALRKLTGDDSPPIRPPAKFENPTLGEAILGAMDRELAIHDASARDDASFQDYLRGKIEDAYMEPLMKVADKELASELTRRFHAANRPRLRRLLALAAIRGGDSVPLKRIVRDLEEGSIVIPNLNDVEEQDRENKEREANEIVACLVDSGLPEADQFLDSLADPAHPQHTGMVSLIFVAPSNLIDRRPVLEHPFCLKFLRNALDDMTSTGTSWTVSGASVEQDGGVYTGILSIMGNLADPSERVDSAEELKCHKAAILVNELIAGLPAVHPLNKNVDETITEMKRLLDVFDGRFRLVSPEEFEALGFIPLRSKSFVPAITPLPRPATPADVANGDAVFELKGNGTLAHLDLPTIGSVLPAAGERRHGAIVVQAETAPDGVTHYGVIERYRLRSITSEHLSIAKNGDAAIDSRPTQ